jgi:DNA-binding response OmpR family regulator
MGNVKSMIRADVMRLLLVEDNRRLSRSLKASLVDAGYAVDAAFDGSEGLVLGEAAPYDAIVLDVMLPSLDGVEVCRALRRRGINVPILMLTARDAVEDRVRGLDSGGDDYLVKPFAVDELLARLRALLRRDSPSRGGILQVHDLIVDPATHAVERAGQPIRLTAKAFALLEFLARHPNAVVSRDTLEQHLWSYDYAGVSNVVDVYIRRLRRQIDDPFEVKLVETIRGVGYRLRAPVSAKPEPVT